MNPPSGDFYPPGEPFTALAKPVKLAKNGVPVDANDWTETDWLDLHRSMKRLIRRVAKRHIKPSPTE